MSGDVVVNFPSGVAKILVAAIEPSGDEIGAALLRELKEQSPGASLVGCGGPAMAAEGLQSLFPIDAFSVMGLTDAVRALPAALNGAGKLAKLAAEANVDAAVFIDGWGFSRLCAVRMRKAAPRVKLFKLAAPQIWASRPRRVDFVRTHFDGVLCLLPFEPPLFEKAGVRADFIGNPNFQAAWKGSGDAARFRKWYEIGDAPLLVVCPGSRKGELNHLMEPFEGAVRLWQTE